MSYLKSEYDNIDRKAFDEAIEEVLEEMNAENFSADLFFHILQRILGGFSEKQIISFMKWEGPSEDAVKIYKESFKAWVFATADMYTHFAKIDFALTNEDYKEIAQRVDAFLLYEDEIGFDHFIKPFDELLSNCSNYEEGIKYAMECEDA